MKYKNIQFDYVSGSIIPFLKLSNKNKEIEENNFKDFVGLMNYSKNKLKGYFNWSTLFNAYQEEKDGRILTERNKLSHDLIYSDSGGLQAARQNKIIDNVFKKKIYQTQNMYSDIAMNFDEMPFKHIAVNAGNHAIGSTDRCYIRELIKTSAELSANHINEQNNVFLELESNTKICPIIHGFKPSKSYFKGENDNTYEDYAKYMFDKIQCDIHGLSIASLTIHSDNRVGILKVIDYVPRTLSSKLIPDENFEHIHLLGLAAPQRILPIMTLAKNDLIDPRVKRISFDSTAITKSNINGRIFRNFNEFKYPTQYPDFQSDLTRRNYKDPTAKNVRHFYQQVHLYFSGYEQYPFSSWEDLADHSPNNGDRRSAGIQFKEKGTEYEIKYLAQIRIFIAYQTWVYLDILEKYLDNELSIDEIIYYNEHIASIYHDIEQNAKNNHDIFEIVEKHYAKVKSEIDHSVDTIEQYEHSLKSANTTYFMGCDETNVLFSDESLEKSSELLKTLNDHKSIIRDKKNITKIKRLASDDNSNIGSVLITNSLF